MKQRNQFKDKLNKLQEALGRIENRQLRMIDTRNIPDNEFRVFSQWGEAGIIQFLLRHILIQNKVFVEYNHRFSPDRAVTVPYDARFVRTAAHHTNIYYGASLKALYSLAGKKGYAFVGCNSAGNNAFLCAKTQSRTSSGD